MKSRLLFKRRRRGSPRVSLFPFLAVLICTMGALVLLLFAVMRQARQQALHAAAAKAGQQQVDVESARGMVQWRIEQLKESRKKTEAQLVEARLYLGHVEDHARQLRQQYAQLQAACQKLEKTGNDTLQRRNATAEELQRLQTQVTDAERRLAAAKENAKNLPRSYAVIPYEGPNQTRRRPIYLECLSDAVVLQPEGIRFPESDFDGPMGPGNPLATALRAAREYLTAQGSFDPEHAGDPYPLLLVRPSGINAYYAALGAMKSWGPEFGYEMIGEEWQLSFPNPDPRMVQVVMQALLPARARQQALVAAAPRKYGRSSKSASRGRADWGGDLSEGVTSADSGESGLRSGRPAGRYAGRYVPGTSDGAGGSGSDTPGTGRPGTGGSGGGGTGSGVGGAGLSGTGTGGTGVGGTGIGGAGAGGSGVGGTGTGGSGIGGSGIGGSGGLGAAGEAPADSTGSGLAMAGGSGARYGPGGLGTGMGGYSGSEAGARPAGVAAGDGASPAGANGAAGAPGGSGSPGGVAGSGERRREGSTEDAGGKVTRPDGYVIGRPIDGTPPPRPAKTEGMVAGTPLRPGEWSPTEKRDDRDAERPPKPRPKSLADKRGDDWGLRDAARGSVPITRPIRVECYPDCLVVAAEPGVASQRVIQVQGRMEGAIDSFVSAVWEHMDFWGIAGKGMYWRPVLNVYVMPGGESRFAEFSALLEGSGFTVQRKQ